MRRLRVAVVFGAPDPWWLPTVLEPFRPDLLDGASPTAYQRSVAGEWLTHGRECIELTSLEEADVAVLGFGLEALPELPQLESVARRAVAEAAAAGKCTLVFCAGDQQIQNPGDAAVVWRTSSHRRTAGVKELPLPAFVADPVTTVTVEPRPWEPVPTVAFTGHAYPLGQQWPSRRVAAVKWTKAIARAALSAAPSISERLGVEPLHPARLAAVAALGRSSAVQPQIRLRSSLTRLDMGRPGDDVQHKEYLDDIGAADYVLAPRGLGNYSYRMYEALAQGRLPIVIDTGMPLPCNELDWDRLSVKVHPWQVPRLGATIRARHAELASGWEARQYECRDAWLGSLAANGYFDRLVERLLRCDAATLADPIAIARALA